MNFNIIYMANSHLSAGRQMKGRQTFVPPKGHSSMSVLLLRVTLAFKPECYRGESRVLGDLCPFRASATV